MDALFDWMLADPEDLKVDYDASDVPIMWPEEEKPKKINGFSLIFQVLGGLWGSKNCKKSIKIGLERFRRVQNDAKTGQERSGQRKMSQHEAPRRLQSGTVLIDGRTVLVFHVLRTNRRTRRKESTKRWPMQVRGYCTNKNMTCQSASIVSRMLCRGRKHVARKALQSPTTNCGREK